MSCSNSASTMTILFSSSPLPGQTTRALHGGQERQMLLWQPFGLQGQRHTRPTPIIRRPSGINISASSFNLGDFIIPLMMNQLGVIVMYSHLDIHPPCPNMVIPALVFPDRGERQGDQTLTRHDVFNQYRPYGLVHSVLV